MELLRCAEITKKPTRSQPLRTMMVHNYIEFCNNILSCSGGGWGQKEHICPRAPADGAPKVGAVIVFNTKYTKILRALLRQGWARKNESCA